MNDGNYPRRTHPLDRLSSGSGSTAVEANGKSLIRNQGIVFGAEIGSTSIATDHLLQTNFPQRCRRPARPSYIGPIVHHLLLASKLSAELTWVRQGLPFDHRRESSCASGTYLVGRKKRSFNSVRNQTSRQRS